MKLAAVAAIALFGLTACMADSGMGEGAEPPSAASTPASPAPAVSTPVVEPMSGGAPAQVTDQAACEASGGSWSRQGRMQSYMCVTRYADAGKSCTDGGQCQGDCRADPDERPTGQIATGQCQANSVPFGCFTRIEDGKVAATLCVD